MRDPARTPELESNRKLKKPLRRDSSALSSSLEASIHSPGSSSSVVTAENSELDSISVICSRLDILEGVVSDSVKIDVAENFLKEISSQVLNSVSVDQLSKKLVDELIKTAVDDLLAGQKERGQFAELIRRNWLLFLLLWILILATYFKNLGARSSFNGPLPT